MKKETEIIKLARLKNGKDFDKWIENTPPHVADIKRIREITKKLDHSMVEDSSK